MIARAVSGDPREPRTTLAHRREERERLARLAEELDRPDRDLIHSIIDRGQTIAALARATGVDRRSLSRRFTRLINRLMDDRVLIVLRERDHWPPQRRRIANALFVRGLTQRAAARQLRISLHALRSELKVIEGLIEADRLTRRRASFMNPPHRRRES